MMANPIILEAVIGLVTAFNIKADVLVSLALIASICIHEDFAAGEVAFIMQLGALLEDLTVAKARAGIEKLVKLTPQTACVFGNGTEKVIPAEQVKVGELIRVLPGETIPVDGVIVSGQTSINQAVMTGESLPVDKAKGDEVSSGTVNQLISLGHLKREKRSGIKENLFHCCCGGNCYRDCWIIKNICFRIRNFETAVSGKVKNLYGTAVFVLIFILIFEEKTHKEISPFSHGKSEL